MNKIKPIAIYLPQYHTIPENDKAWGEGFTEWTNVKKAQPLFEGHYQPHVPHESVGYYDLSDPEVLVRQANMAKEYGIYGFAYYHYWFNGKLLLNQPLDNMLATGKPDFPFCYIWANENWTKRWDGLENEVIIKQEYSFDDDRQHIRFLCENVFSDKRYITVDNKPLFIIYRTELFPDIEKTANIWREEAKKFGYEGIYLVRVESLGERINPESINFDAAIEFAPDWHALGEKVMIQNNSLQCFDYATTLMNMFFKLPNYKLYRCVFPSWDNTARRGSNSTVFVNNSVEAFKYSLKRAVDYTLAKFGDQERFVFINAWNEWGEGCHIEPDKKNGFAFLEICKNGFNELPENDNSFKQILRMNELNKDLKNSWSYRIGNFLIKPLTKLRTLFNA